MKKIIILFLSFLVIITIISFYIYHRDKNKYQPRLWIGLFDYRLNFRDVGQSLNQCFGKEIFYQDKIYRSNRYFSGWSCNKIHNPDKIYSLNFSPWNPHAYYCEQNAGNRLVGFNSNTTFEISDIEKLSNWGRPEFKKSMCIFFKDTLIDLTQHKSFLYHCDMGRDRTGAFTAMLTMILAEQKSFDKLKMADAIECDYEKTHSLEKNKIGKMKNFLKELEAQGGVSQFIGKQCGISKEIFVKAANNFIY